MKFFILILLFPVFVQAKVRIAVLDTGVTKEVYIKLKSEGKVCTNINLTDETPWDIHGHGTNVIGLIENKLKGETGYCYIIIKWFSKKSSNLAEGIKVAFYTSPDFVNISGGGLDFIKKEKFYLTKMLERNTKIIAASGNENTNLNEYCNFFPACYDHRILVIGNKGNKSNYGNKIVDYTIDGNNKTGFGVTMSGSSQSTALFTGLYVKLVLKGKRE